MGGEGGEGEEKREKRQKAKPREGREPELNIFIDKKFNYWNLPVKAKTVLLSNVPQEITHTDLLYNLFSFYGDVEKIKLLRNRNNCALVEFSAATFAAIARDHLDQANIRGAVMAVSFSRYERIRMPHEIGLPPDSNIKDFSGPEYKKFKRYWNEDFKKSNMKKIIKPKVTVHIGGLTGSQSPNDLLRLFQSAGLSVTGCVGVAVKTKKKKEDENSAPAPPGTAGQGSGRMFAYLEFGSVDDAIIGLAQYGNSAGMRISFAKDSLNTLKQNCLEKKLTLIEGEQKTA